MLYITSSFLKRSSVDGIVIKILRAMIANKIPFRISEHSSIDQKYIKEFGNIVEIRPRNSFQLVINPLCFLNHYGIDSKTIVYTVWDTNEITPHEAFTLNLARHIIVSSEANKQTFVNAGIDPEKITVVPLGYDQIIYNNRVDTNQLFNTLFSGLKQPEKKTFVFGSGGQMVEAKDDKKNLEKVIRCFLAAFGRNDDVKLSIKLPPESPKPLVPSLDRVDIIHEDLEDHKMADWYHSIDCYVHLSKYEAFGLQPLEAMGCGKPIITHKVGGNVITPSSLVVSNDNCKPQGIYKIGEWRDPKEDEVISTMRFLYKNQSYAKHLGMMVSDEVKDMTFDSFFGNFLKIIVRYTYL